jgi:myo-inositol-1(or 4)-monophosphatase
LGTRDGGIDVTDFHHRAAIAERAARAGGAVAREFFRQDLSVETKDNKNDLVTEADRDAQQQVLATVWEEFPDDDFVCEEETGELRGPEADAGEARLVEAVPESGACWVVDPIDGTSNFVRETRTWATSIAAVVGGEAVGSATYLPAMGDLYAAGPESAERDGTALSVSDRDDPETFAASPVGYWPWDQRDEFVDLFEAVVERFGDARRVGSFQTTLAYVADGGLDVAICTRKMDPWDTVAGVHMVREAGGTVTDVHGDRWHHDSDSVVASNGNAHDVVVEAAQQALED